MGKYVVAQRLHDICWWWRSRVWISIAIDTFPKNLFHTIIALILICVIYQPSSLWVRLKSHCQFYKANFLPLWSTVNYYVMSIGYRKECRALKSNVVWLNLSQCLEISPSLGNHGPLRDKWHRLGVVFPLCPWSAAARRSVHQECILCGSQSSTAEESRKINVSRRNSENKILAISWGKFVKSSCKN